MRYYGNHRYKRKPSASLNRKMTLHCPIHGEIIDYSEFNKNLIFEVFNKEKSKVELKCYKCLEEKISVEKEKYITEYSIIEKKAKQLYGRKAEFYKFIGLIGVYFGTFGSFVFIWLLGWEEALISIGFSLLIGVISNLKGGAIQNRYNSYLEENTRHLQYVSNASSVVEAEAKVVSSWRYEQAQIIKEQNRLKIEKMNYSMEEIDKMSGVEFEHFVKNLLLKNGYENPQITKASGDEGVDIITYKNGKKIAVQCKRYSGKISNSAIQQVFSGMHYYNCQESYVITNSYFTENAISLAKKHKVKLINRNKLFDMMENSRNV